MEISPFNIPSTLSHTSPLHSIYDPFQREMDPKAEEHLIPGDSGPPKKQKIESNTQGAVVLGSGEMLQVHQERQMHVKGCKYEGVITDGKGASISEAPQDYEGENKRCVLSTSSRSAIPRASLSWLLALHQHFISLPNLILWPIIFSSRSCEIAFDFLTIPAASSAVERLFSKVTWHTPLTRRRALLAERIVDATQVRFRSWNGHQKCWKTLEGLKRKQHPGLHRHRRGSAVAQRHQLFSVFSGVSRPVGVQLCDATVLLVEVTDGRAECQNVDESGVDEFIHVDEFT
uniref:HAT C-terminal dimerisation domain-containing protein n=1 Tax=Ditylenchus dipsaci TaxID=166011 RepID=A0A915ELW2_9BILA